MKTSLITVCEMWCTEVGYINTWADPQSFSHGLILNFFPFIYQHFIDSFWQGFIHRLWEPKPEEPGSETEGTKNEKL